MYLHGESNEAGLSLALEQEQRYLFVMLFGILPFALEQVYTSTLGECGETVIPMKAGVAAVMVNLILNYILIFGKFGAPALGVVGAGMATLMQCCSVRGLEAVAGLNISSTIGNVFMWVISMPFAYILSRYTTLPIVLLYLLCRLIEIIKCFIGFVLVKKGVWLQNIVVKEEYGEGEKWK